MNNAEHQGEIILKMQETFLKVKKQHFSTEK